MRHVGRRPPLPAPRGVPGKHRSHSGRWHDDGPHLEWASPLASRPHRCALPARGEVSQPGAGGLAPRQRGGVTHCPRHRQVLELSLFDPVPAAGTSAPRHRCLAKSLPAVPAPAAPEPPAVCAVGNGSSPPPRGSGGGSGQRPPLLHLLCRAEPARHGVYPCHRVGEQGHRLLDTLHVQRRAGTGVHQPSAWVQVLHPKREWYLTRRTLGVLWGPLG